MAEKRRKTGFTAEQIAKKVGVSNATVSRILNNTQYVSPEAREAVMAVIRESGTTPRLLGPRAKQKSTLADYVEILLVHRFEPNAVERAVSQRTYPTSGLIENLIRELGEFGLRGVVQVTNNLQDPSLLTAVNQNENRGLFLTGNYGDDVHPFVDKCRCPVVSFMSWPSSGWPDYVGIDNLIGIQLGFDHLRQLGHTRIGYIAGELEFTYVFHQRLAAYKMCMAEADLPWKPEWICQGSCDPDTLQQHVLRMLRLPNRPTAILCAFDTAAIAVRRAVDELRLHIPDDISVVGFDDDVIAQLFSPPLTTVRVPADLIARHAVQLMAMRQQRPISPGEGVSVRVMPKLTIRSSTAAPAVKNR